MLHYSVRTVRNDQGLNSSTEILQHRLTEVLEGIPGVIVEVDEILVHAATVKQHDRRLDQVLDRIAACGMRLNKKKCKFRVSLVKSDLHSRGHETESLKDSSHQKPRSNSGPGRSPQILWYGQLSRTIHTTPFNDPSADQRFDKSRRRLCLGPQAAGCFRPVQTNTLI